MKNAYIIGSQSDEFLSVYEHLIEPAVTESGLSPFTHLGDSSENLATAFAGFDILIADITDSNPSVLYQVGLCHGINKPAILISQSISDLPQYLHGYQIIIYSTRFDLAVNLISDLKKAIKIIIEDGIYSSPAKDYNLNQYNNELKLGNDIQKILYNYQIPFSPSIDPTFNINAVEEMTKSSLLIQDYTNSFANKLTQHAINLQRINSSSNAGRHEIFKRIVSLAANDMIIYANNLRSQRSSIDEGVDFIIKSIDMFSIYFNNTAIPEGDESVFNFRLTVKELMNNTSDAVVSLIDLRDQMSSTPPLTKELESASKRISSEINFIVSNFINLKASCERALSLINSKEGGI